MPDETFESEAIDPLNNTKSYQRVKEAIEAHDRTITLSCGQLTTGVTIPEWTAVFMLSNIKSPSLYFQAAFRAQNPYQTEKDGKYYQKDNAYVFDFAPERTLELYDALANELIASGDGHDPSERKNKIQELLNFFPVVAEDDEGRMHELDAEEILSIPRRIKAVEVVKRGFMSNLLFDNVFGIFGAPQEIRGILEKIQPEKNKRLQNRGGITVTNPLLNEKGEVEIPVVITINTTKNLFGEKIYNPPIIPTSNPPEIKHFVDKVVQPLEDGFEKMGNEFQLNKGQLDYIKKNFKNKIQVVAETESKVLEEKLEKIQIDYQEILQRTQSVEAQKMLQEDVTKKEEEAKTAFQKDMAKTVTEVVRETVKKQEERVEEKKKRTTEDEVRDHLRGFTRTIPSFLMAYGDHNTTLANFDEHIDPTTFQELTSITLEEFRKLRDGFNYTDEDGEKRQFKGFFDELVFNTSVQEFFRKKDELANYFDDSLGEDIFDYIPPQKTNQIFTPRAVVSMMVDALELENPSMFTQKETTFIDLYAKSGLFLTELAKRLNQGLEDQIPEQQERMRWILEHQLYGCAPSDIIYRIAKNYVYGIHEDVNPDNLVLCDTAVSAQNQTMQKDISGAYGDENMKFDVIIGNPPYQEEVEGENKNFSRPIYNEFLNAAYGISDIVEMIHPARFLFNAGSTPKTWNEKMLKDPHLKVLFFSPTSKDIFPNTDIKGGVAVTYRDSNYVSHGIGTFIPFKELAMIKEKVWSLASTPLSEIVYTAESYKLTNTLHMEHPSAKSKLSKGHENDVRTNIFEKLPEIFLEEIDSKKKLY